jgi:hypothetical protein
LGFHDDIGVGEWNKEVTDLKMGEAPGRNPTRRNKECFFCKILRGVGIAAGGGGGEVRAEDNRNTYFWFEPSNSVDCLCVSIIMDQDFSS